MSLSACARSSEPPAADRRAATPQATLSPTGHASASSGPTHSLAATSPAPLGKHWLGQLPQGTSQLVRVASGSWQADHAELQRYALTDAVWEKVGDGATVSIGKTGLGWGRGVHRPETDGPQKAEGDKRAPAGLFRLSQSFGYGPGAQLKTGLPHRAVSPSWRCVDDPRSAHYTEILDGDALPRGETADWQSAERMQRRDELYEIVIWADHNRAPPVPGAGSCIFLHTWLLRDAKPQPTVGCTSMPRAVLAELAAWLKPGAILAQLPEAELHRD